MRNAEAEECAQNAFTAALERWPKDGVPRNPGAWLTTVARNRALDRLRRKTTETAKIREAALMSAPAEPDPTVDDGGIGDDRLRLIFTCCHPALSLEARVALTLRTLAGLSTAEIARACLVSEQTMAKRLVRAKKKIQNAAIPYRVPPAHLLPERAAGVRAVLYLLFNEGYAASAGDDLVRQGLCAEAIRLARLLDDGQRGRAPLPNPAARRDRQQRPMTATDCVFCDLIAGGQARCGVRPHRGRMARSKIRRSTQSSGRCEPRSRGRRLAESGNLRIGWLTFAALLGRMLGICGSAEMDGRQAHPRPASTRGAQWPVTYHTCGR